MEDDSNKSQQPDNDITQINSGDSESDNDRTQINPGTTQDEALQDSTQLNPTADTTVINPDQALLHEDGNDATLIAETDPTVQKTSFAASKASTDDDATVAFDSSNLEASSSDPEATVQKTGYMPAPELPGTHNDDATQIAGADSDATQIQGDDITGRTDGSWVPQVTMFGERENERSGPVEEGDTLNDRFYLEKKLGVGGMGVVYLARDKRKEEAQDRNPHVALKILGEDFKNHPQAFIALQREARKTQELAHPNIVTVYDFDRDGDNVFLTMEVLKGLPLDEDIKERGKENPRPLEDAITIIRSMAKGLAYAHHKKLVHSDLKPGNAFLAPDNEVKLLDFGIARACNIDRMEKSEGDDTIFDAGELGALTPSYASLEMLTGQEPHPSDDVYALGIMAYEVLTGNHPYNRKMAHEAMQEGFELKKVDGLRKNQWLAIEKALAFSRDDRIQNAQEFIDLFDKTSNKGLIAATGVVVAAIIAVGAAVLLTTPEAGPEIAFEELPVEIQAKIEKELKDAEMSLKFNDFNSAIIHLDRANNLHERNLRVSAMYEKVLPQIEQLLDQQDKTTALKQVEQLMSYPSLKNNALLLEMKNKYGG